MGTELEQKLCAYNEAFENLGQANKEPALDEAGRTLLRQNEVGFYRTAVDLAVTGFDEYLAAAAKEREAGAEDRKAMASSRKVLAWLTVGIFVSTFVYAAGFVVWLVHTWAK